MAERRINLNNSLVDALGDSRSAALAEALMFAEASDEVDEELFATITDLMGDIAEQYELGPDDMDSYARTITSCYISGLL